MRQKTLHIGLLVAYLLVLVWSGIHPRDLTTWVLEVLPSFVLALILVITYRRFPLTNLAYVLLWISVIFTAIGGHYTYANVPFFDYIREWFHFKRNHYDRFVHFFQSVTIAIVSREVLLRITPLRPGKMLFFLIISVCLAFAALYEISEFTVAKLTGTAADAFLGTQGDVWDSQWDLTFNLFGGIVSLLLLRKLHDRFLYRQIKNNGF